MLLSLRFKGVQPLKTLDFRAIIFLLNTLFLAIEKFTVNKIFSAYLTNLVQKSHNDPLKINLVSRIIRISYIR